MDTFLAIAGDQQVIAGIAVLLFSIFIWGCYVAYQERKSRRDPNWFGDWPL